MRPALATAEVLVDAAPSRRDDYIRLDLARDMRHRVRMTSHVGGIPSDALAVNEEQIQAHRYLPERELITVLAEHAEDVAELVHRVRRHGIRVEMHHVVADTAEFIKALDKGHTIQRPAQFGPATGIL